MSYSKEELIELIKLVNQQSAAYILESSDITPFTVQRFPINLSSARSEADPLVIGFPFKTLWVKDANSQLIRLNVKLNKNDSSISQVSLKDNDIIKSDRMYSSAFISWAAVPNGNVDVYVFTSTEISSGSLINSGTITQSLPSTGNETAVGIASTGVVQSLIAANPARRKLRVRNETGNVINVKFDNNNNLSGDVIPDGSSLDYYNTGQLFVIGTAIAANAALGVGIILTEEI